MSVELRDLRAKVTIEADVALEAASRITGKDKAEICRDVLHAWALDEIRKATVMHRLLQSEGLPGAHEGSQGELRETRSGGRR